MQWFDFFLGFALFFIRFSVGLLAVSFYVRYLCVVIIRVLIFVASYFMHFLVCPSVIPVNEFMAVVSVH